MESTSYTHRQVEVLKPHEIASYVQNKQHQAIAQASKKGAITKFEEKLEVIEAITDWKQAVKIAVFKVARAIRK
jgi:hypothetical protein